jgi:hypothetical protein
VGFSGLEEDFVMSEDTGFFQAFGRILDKLTGNEQESRPVSTGADLVAYLWCDSPEDWTEVGSTYPVVYKHKSLNLKVFHRHVYGTCEGASFDGELLGIPDPLAKKMHQARDAYNRGKRNAKMDATSRKLAEAILRMGECQ